MGEIKDVACDGWAHICRFEGGKMLTKTPWGSEVATPSSGASLADFATTYTLGYHAALKAIERAVREELATGLTEAAALDSALVRLAGLPPDEATH